MVSRKKISDDRCYLEKSRMLFLETKIILVLSMKTMNLIKT